MSTMDPASAYAFAGARLGREPQDMLEAAVVLEAWSGMPAGEALPLGNRLMREAPAAPRASVARHAVAGGGREFTQALALAVTVLAASSWAVPLAHALGAGTVQRALCFALPLTFALQWALRGNTPVRRTATALVGSQWVALALVLVLAVTPAIALGDVGVLALLLVTTWTGGALLARRGLAFVYAGIVVGGTVAMIAGQPADLVLLVLAVVVLLVAALPDDRHVAAEANAGREVSRWPWVRTVTAASIGAGLGLLMVADGTVSWTAGPLAALVLLPSSLGSLWGGLHLWHLPRALAGGLAGVAVGATRVRGGMVVPIRILAGALLRLVVVTVVVSVAIHVTGVMLDLDAPGFEILLAFGLIALATLLAGLLEAVGRGAWALSAVAAGVAVELLVGTLAPDSLTAAGLLAGALTCVAVAIPLVLLLLLRPAETLATTLYVQ